MAISKHEVCPPWRGMLCNKLMYEINRTDAIATIIANHYTHSVSSGKTHYFKYDDALVAWSIPANCNISNFLIGRPRAVWELSRLWAPDGHERNLLTKAISATLKELRKLEPQILAVVSYADPNAGHTGGVYRAASWVYCGQCEETRHYVGPNGLSVSRRKFHSGGRSLIKSKIEALGFVENKKPGKHRYALGLRKWSRKVINKKFNGVRAP